MCGCEGEGMKSEEVECEEARCVGGEYFSVGWEVNL